MIDLPGFQDRFIFDQLRDLDRIISDAGSEYNPNEAVLLILSESLRKASQGGRIEISRRLPDWIKKQNLILIYLPKVDRNIIFIDSLVSKLKFDSEIASQENDLNQIAELISGSSKSEYSLLLGRLPRWIQECDAVFYRLKLENKIQIICISLEDTEGTNSVFIIQRIVKILSELSERECQQFLIRMPHGIIEQEEIIPFLLPEDRIKTLTKKLSSQSAGNHEFLAAAQIADAFSKIPTESHHNFLDKLPDWIKKQPEIFCLLPPVERNFICLDSLVSKLKCDKEISNWETDLNQIIEFISGSSQSEYLLLIEKLPRWVQESDVVFYRLKFEGKIQVICTSLADTERTNSGFIIQQTVKILSELSERECQKLLIILPHWIIEQEEIIPFLLPEDRIKKLTRKLSNQSSENNESLAATQLAEAFSEIPANKHQNFLDKLPDWIKEQSEIFCLLSPTQRIKLLSVKFTRSNNTGNDSLIRSIGEILSKLDMGERESLLSTLPDKIKFYDSIFALLSFENKLYLLLKQTSIESQGDLEFSDFKKFLISEIPSNLSNQDFDRNKLQQWLNSKREQWSFELQRQEQERLAIRQFINLKEKYFAKEHKKISPLSPLYPILIKIDSDECLEEGQIEFLKQNRLFGTLAMYCQRIYKRTHEPWELVKASGYWRDNSQPLKSIQITDELLHHNNSLNERIRAATFTTRGGAFRDLRQLEDAEHCAKSAIQVDPRTYYPYNLLGAIYFERGNAKQGEVCFLKALELGAPQRSQEEQMKGALKNAGQAERQSVAQYLLQRDPAKYQWVHRYLKRII